MAAPATFTVTGKAGPGNTLTAAVFTNVVSFSFDVEKEILTLFRSGAVPPVIVDVSAATTWTVTGSVVAVTIA